MAAAEKIERGYLGSLLRLTLLVQSVLDGRQPDDITLPRLMEPFPAEWSAQRERSRTVACFRSGVAPIKPDKRLGLLTAQR